MLGSLLPQGFALTVALLTVGLDYYFTDKRRREFKTGRRWLLVAILLAGVVGLIGSYRTFLDQQRDMNNLQQKLDDLSAAPREREQAMLKRLLTHVERELDLNFLVIQGKEGTSFGLSMGMATGRGINTPEKFELAIEMLRVEKFYSMVPSIWGEDMALLGQRGADGERAQRALLRWYGTLKQTQERESDLLNKLQHETRPEWKQTTVRVLHQEYETLREILMQTGKACVPILKEFGLARGVKP